MSARLGPVAGMPSGVSLIADASASVRTPRTGHPGAERRSAVECCTSRRDPPAVVEYVDRALASATRVPCGGRARPGSAMGAHQRLRSNRRAMA